MVESTKEAKVNSPSEATPPGLKKSSEEPEALGDEGNVFPASVVTTTGVVEKILLFDPSPASSWVFDQVFGESKNHGQPVRAKSSGNVSKGLRTRTLMKSLGELMISTSRADLSMG